MKTLYIVRHAKSSWSFNQLDDFSRPLGLRGRKDVMRMGKYIAANYPVPGQMFTSPASRAFYTSLFYADAWKFPEEEIVLEPQLYHADEEEIIEVLSNDAAEDIVAVFGHNPGFTDLANVLTGQYVDNIPTCAIYGVTFNIDDWSELKTGIGKTSFFVRPKEIKS